MTCFTKNMKHADRIDAKISQLLNAIDAWREADADFALNGECDASAEEIWNKANCNVVGKIVNCAVEESAMTNGQPDAEKMRPICFDTCGHVYRLMGDVVAKTFSCGKELM